jgi:hypothetical protein
MRSHGKYQDNTGNRTFEWESFIGLFQKSGEKQMYTEVNKQTQSFGINIPSPCRKYSKKWNTRHARFSIRTSHRKWPETL